jgi:hypothetical protein
VHALCLRESLHRPEPHRDISIAEADSLAKPRTVELIEYSPVTSYFLVPQSQHGFVLEHAA